MKNLYWGDTHLNIRANHIDELDAIFDEYRGYLDFAVMAYYPGIRELRGERGYDPEVLEPPELLEKNWLKINALYERRRNDPELVMFPGYEWQGIGLDGDHNVFYLEPGQPMLNCPRLEELYRELEKLDSPAMAIPHHIAYKPGTRSKNWDVQDDALSPFAEIFSGHGCSESDEEWIGLRRNWQMGPNVSGSTYQDGLDRAYHVGAIASGDNHNGFSEYGRGFMGCHAEKLSPEGLWEAFSERHVYGVTGDRIRLDFSIDDAFMGDILRGGGPYDIKIDVRGCDALDRIELLRDGRVIATHCHQGSWDIPRDGKFRCKIRYEMGWGPVRPWIEELEAQNWQGEIKVRGGSILNVEKCFTNRAQKVCLGSDDRCVFDLTTRRFQKAPMPVTDAVILEIEGTPETVLEYSSNDSAWHDRCTLAEAMNCSNIIYNPEQTDAYIRKYFKVEKEEFNRHDDWYFFAFKVKRHRAVPESGYTAAMRIREPENISSAHYRVRVEQRNAQRAWSSPIWTEC